MKLEKLPANLGLAVVARLTCLMRFGEMAWRVCVDWQRTGQARCVPGRLSLTSTQQGGEGEPDSQVPRLLRWSYPVRHGGMSSPQSHWLLPRPAVPAENWPPSFLTPSRHRMLTIFLRLPLSCKFSPVSTSPRRSSLLTPIQGRWSRGLGRFRCHLRSSSAQRCCWFHPGIPGWFHCRGIEEDSRSQGCCSP